MLQIQFCLQITGFSSHKTKKKLHLHLKRGNVQHEDHDKIPSSEELSRTLSISQIYFHFSF